MNIKRVSFALACVMACAISALFLVQPIGELIERMSGPSFAEKKAWARDFSEGLSMQRNQSPGFMHKIQSSEIPIKIAETGHKHEISLYVIAEKQRMPIGFKEFGTMRYTTLEDVFKGLVLVWEENALRPAISINGGEIRDASLDEEAESQLETIIILRGEK